MTAVENVAVPLEFEGGEARQTCGERSSSSAVGLGRLSHYPGQLSGSEQQQVALQSLCGQAKILRQATGNLDRRPAKL